MYVTVTSVSVVINNLLFIIANIGIHVADKNVSAIRSRNSVITCCINACLTCFVQNTESGLQGNGPPPAVG